LRMNCRNELNEVLLNDVEKNDDEGNG